MRQLLMITILSIAFAVCNSPFANAEIPHLINYQGKLTDSDGKPITGTKSITFRIYDVSSGGTPLWSETQSVTVDKGIFNVLLGSSTDLNLAFDKSYYLGIKVETDAEMTPRQRMTAAGYAFKAEMAGDVDTLPRGSIILWYGSIASIPAGWALCDGTNGTPDLRDKFVVGAREDVGGVPRTNVTGSLTQTGGTVSHNHSGGTSSDTSGDYRAWNAPPGNSGFSGDASKGWHSHTFTANSRENVPPYYSLAYIMKL